MSQKIYIVEGVSFAHCRAAVTEEVEQVDGVREVSVDLDAKAITVLGESFDDAGVRAAVAAAGYEVGA
ncbi:MAG: heavy-metal-associated domain-containing protein [Thermoleophilaceae bacterium]|nr:heavy-metal-associated domain-containing protein [Thermoleophilaceae bacterium]